MQTTTLNVFPKIHIVQYFFREKIFLKTEFPLRTVCLNL